MKKIKIFDTHTEHENCAIEFDSETFSSLCSFVSLSPSSFISMQFIFEEEEDAVHKLLNDLESLRPISAKFDSSFVVELG